MTILVGGNRYEVVLQNRYYLRELIEQLTLEESLDEVAYRATITLAASEQLPEIAPGQEIRVSGIPFGGNSWAYLLEPGVVWKSALAHEGAGSLEITAYDRAIYLAKSEDEYLLPAGQTAAQRLKRYAADWGVDLGDIADTGIPLSKAIYRSQPLYRMIASDLRETAMKGGGLFRVRMAPAGLELVRIGSNAAVWMLESESNLESVQYMKTLEGTVTQVKVLGLQRNDDELSPVLAIEKGDVGAYGTLQRVLQAEKDSSVDESIRTARQLIGGYKESVLVKAIDINTIRAGDAVSVDGIAYIVVSVRHELGDPGHMTLELAGEDEVRRNYYYG